MGARIIKRLGHRLEHRAWAAGLRLCLRVSAGLFSEECVHVQLVTTVEARG